MKKIITLSTLLISTSCAVGASSSDSALWTYGGGGGVTRYTDMISYDNVTPFVRLYGARHVTQIDSIKLGVELGIQTGNDGRIKMNATQSNDLGNVAVQSIVKPSINFLLTASKPVNLSYSFDIFAKAGLVYRQFQLDRDTMNTLRKVNPEIQVGISKSLTSKTSIALAYQGVFSGRLDLTTSNTVGDTGDGTGNVKHIPSQHGALLTIAITA